MAACGSGRSTSDIPAVPAAWSVTTIAFIVRLLCRVLIRTVAEHERDEHHQHGHKPEGVGGDSARALPPPRAVDARPRAHARRPPPASCTEGFLTAAQNG